MGNYLFLLLILACPLVMIWMMRSGHGGNAGDGRAQEHGSDRGHGHSDSNASLDELRRQREQLDRNVRGEEETLAQVDGGWR